MELNITQFIASGEFGFVRIGITKEELEHQCFPPDDWLANATKKTSSIWRYGNFELHFHDGSVLSGIFNDYLPHIDGGAGIVLCDKWILGNREHAPTLLETMGALNTLGVNFAKKRTASGNVHIALPHGVYMVFDNPQGKTGFYTNELPMSAIGKAETGGE